jgi:hypothetical protein
MALNANDYKQESKFERPEPLDPGTYPARVAQVISMGLQKQRPYKGEEKDPRHEIHVTYELLDEFLKDEDGDDITDKPRWLSENFTMNSLDSDLAKSTKRYLALDPNMEYDGDWSKLAGAPCMVTLTQTASKKDASIIYNNITSVQTMRAKEAAKAPELKNVPKIFDIDEPDIEIFNAFPKWLQDKIKDNLEFGGSVLEKALRDEKNTDRKESSKADESKKKDKAKEEESSDDEENW